ncbi:MAG TPA: transposase [Candidatus Sulfotelmatobacter sp.]
MELRELRGMELAATRTIRKRDGWWVVPSQAGNGLYRVQLAKKFATCECPDFEKRGTSCKHIFAATFVSRREQNPDGSVTVTESLTVTAEKQTTYPQAWAAYNEAQTNEKDKFQALLFDLCNGIPLGPRVKKNGRPTLPLSDAIFSVTFKVYSTVSARRFMTDLRDAQGKGFIAKTPHYNSVINYLENPELTPLLKSLITQSSLPLKSVETDFAADSSGFMTSRFTRWYDHKYGVEKTKADWVKCHLMCGTKTNIVTAVEIHSQHAADTKMLPALASATAMNFTMHEVSADKGYASKANYESIARLGATPFISFPESHKGQGGGKWAEMFHYFNFRKQEFLQHYHKRSNVESTFSMMKRKFGDSIRSKTDTAMVNEVLCKVLCHNLVVLIHEMYELGIDPVFWSKATVN